MCTTTAYKSTTCSHRWLTITKRCSDQAGFTNTPVHEFRPSSRTLMGGQKFWNAPAGSCPNCDMKGQYNGNTTRLVMQGQRRYERHCGGPRLLVGNGGMGVAGYRQGYGGGVGYPPMGMMNGYGLALTPYQQSYAANAQAKETQRWQYYPQGGRQSYMVRSAGQPGCNVM